MANSRDHYLARLTLVLSWMRFSIIKRLRSLQRSLQSEGERKARRRGADLGQGHDLDLNLQVKLECIDLTYHLFYLWPPFRSKKSIRQTNLVEKTVEKDVEIAVRSAVGNLAEVTQIVRSFKTVLITSLFWYTVHSEYSFFSIIQSDLHPPSRLMG